MRTKKILTTALAAVVIASLSLSGFWGSKVQAREGDRLDPLPTFKQLDFKKGAQNNKDLNISSLSISDVSSEKLGVLRDENSKEVDKSNKKIKKSQVANNKYSMKGDTDNTTPNGAEYINFNSAVGGTINEEGGDRWYVVYTDVAARISSLMMANDDSSDFDLIVYSLNTETGDLTNIGYSATEAGNQEIVDLKVDAGYYFIRVNSYSGTGDFALISYLSKDYINDEINDSFDTAVEKNGACTITGAVDSLIDLDVYKFTISSEDALKKFTLASPENCNYCMYLAFASDTSKLYSVTSDSTYSLKKGTYYLIVTTADGTYDSTSPYTLNVTETPYVEGATVLINSDGYIIQRSGTNYYVNGKLIDMNFVYKYDVSAGSDYLHDKMTLTVTSDSVVKSAPYYEDGEQYPGIMLIGYKSTFTPYKTHAIYIPIQNARYYYYRTASASMAPTYVYQNATTTAAVIIDADTGKASDIYAPNWFYTSSASHHTHSISNVYEICTIE